jgi:hypothetical protein
MSSSTKSLFIETYKPLVTDFISKIRTTQYDKIPQPFLPLHGQLYHAAQTKIVFVGMETRGWGNMKDFVNEVEKDFEQAILKEFDEFDELDFCFWGNNFGSSFWDFNFKFLANFYNIDDWKKVKRGKEEEILRSFAWGNTNSIESYGVTAEKKGVDYESWEKVKNASKCFDKARYLLDVLQPNIMVIVNWGASEEWLSDGLNEKLVGQEIDDHFWYYFLGSTQTHVLWTAHPTWLSKNRDFDDYIEYLVDFVKQKL